jgi:hypothetical protein
MDSSPSSRRDLEGNGLMRRILERKEKVYLKLGDLSGLILKRKKEQLLL